MRHEHAGAAKVTTLTAELGATGADLTIPCADLTNWPTGSIGTFYAALGKGTLTEEKVLLSARAGNTLQVFSDVSGTGRGADGTVAQTHPAGTTIEHIWTATEADEANAHLNSGDGAHGYPPPADLVTLTGAQTIHDKTLVTPALDAPVSDGGSFDNADHMKADLMKALGPQAEAEFRVRNTYIGSGPPDNALGNDGDMYVDKG